MSFKINARRIVVTQGDTICIPLCFSHDITGAVIHLQVRHPDTGAVLIDVKEQNHVNAENGISVLKVPTQASTIPAGVYETDIEITYPNGDRLTFFPVEAGTVGSFEITKQVTREV